MLSAVAADDRIHELVSDWLSSYVMRPHRELGRRGSVCPYVAQALATDNVSLAVVELGEEKSLETMNRAIEDGIERFRALQVEKGDSELLSLILTFPDLGSEHWHLIDEGHRASKPGAVREGLMLGQFHPTCEAPAAHNPSFAVNRAPVPLIVIRNMAPHDYLFLDQDPVWLEHYERTLTRRGIPLGNVLRWRAGRSDDAIAPDRARPDEERASYVEYACTDRLQEMQFPKSDSPLELSFILITQVKELLFRMLYVELDVTRAHVRDSEIAKACGALGRASRVQRVLLTSWDTLTGMSATDFMGFREVLGDASGRQSFMYRALEFIMGNRDEDSVEHLRARGPLHRILDREVAEPSLYDEVVAYLSRNVRPIDEAVLGREVSGRYEASPDVEAAWLEVYRDPRRYPAEYSLAEALSELAFQFSQWRATHLLVVERMIGSKRGTGDTDGVQWLRRINEHRFFPELWTVRTRI